MRLFDRKLGLVLEALDSRTIVIGKYGIMSKLKDGINLMEPVEGELSKRHPELDDVEFSHSMNPDLLVTIDQGSGLRGTGSNNCVTCAHFTPGELCPKWLADGNREVMLDQDTVSDLSVGGCILHEFLPWLGDEVSNEQFDSWIEAALDSNTVIIVRDGSVVDYMSPEDLGVTDYE